MRYQDIQADVTHMVNGLIAEVQENFDARETNYMYAMNDIANDILEYVRHARGDMEEMYYDVMEIIDTMTNGLYEGEQHPLTNEVAYLIALFREKYPAKLLTELQTFAIVDAQGNKKTH